MVIKFNKMKGLFLAVISSLLIPALVKAQPATDVPESAENILKAAYKQAVMENKNVFIMFHASWCGWCHKMDNSMNDPVCKKFFEDNYVIRHLVVDESKDKIALENPGANEMRNKYYGAGQGIPFWLVFDKEGKLLADSKIRKPSDGPEAGENAGCPASEEEVNYFVDVLKKTSKLSMEQEDIIRTRFRQNAQ